jgi:TolB-like protein
MNRRVMTGFAALLLCGWLAVAGAQEKRRLAVLSFAHEGAGQEAEAITEELRRAFVQSGQFVVIDRTLTDQILKEWELQQSGLTEAEKAVKIGKLFNVQVIVTGKLNRFASGGWQVSAAMLEAQTGVTRKAETVRHRGEFFALLDAKVPALARGLLGQPGRPPQPPPARPAAAEAPRTRGAKTLALFPASFTGAGAGKLEQANRKMIAVLQKVLERHRERVTPTHSFYPLPRFPDAKEFGRGHEDFAAKVWGGGANDEPNKRTVKRVAARLGVELVLMYRVTRDRGSVRTYAVYLFDARAGKMHRKAGEWEKGERRPAMAKAVAGLLRKVR